MKPRKIGRCLVPPRGLTFSEYRSDKHGPLVDCKYETAAYEHGEGPCAFCGKLGCSHPVLMGRMLSREEWKALPDFVGKIDKKGIWHR